MRIAIVLLAIYTIILEALTIVGIPLVFYNPPPQGVTKLAALFTGLLGLVVYTPVIAFAILTLVYVFRKKLAQPAL